MNVRELYSTCSQLKTITSTKEKEQFLIDHRSEDLDRLLKFLLDPAVVTGLDKKRIRKKVPENTINSQGPAFKDFGELLSYVKSNNSGSNQVIVTCQVCTAFIALEETKPLGYFDGAYVDHLLDFMEDILTKKLRLGVNLKLVNKVYGKDFIYVHEVQLGSPRDKLRLKDGEWFSLSRKLNGIRCTYVDGELISRQGKKFNGLNHILNYLTEKVGRSVVIDGELIRKNVDHVTDNENFRLTTSLVNGEDGDKTQLELVIFDCLSLSEFRNGKSTTNYQQRHALLDQIGLNAKFFGVNIRPVEIVYQGTDQSEIEKQLAIADAKDWEGLMLNKNRPYECKRTTSLIKIKSFKFSDLMVLSVNEGSGKYANMLGSLTVDYKGNPVNVGSGFDDTQRIEFWKDPPALVGRIVTVKYKDVSKDSKTGKESLQFPIFCELREEGKEVSYE